MSNIRKYINPKLLKFPPAYVFDYEHWNGMWNCLLTAVRSYDPAGFEIWLVGTKDLSGASGFDIWVSRQWELKYCGEKQKILLVPSEESVYQIIKSIMTDFKEERGG